MKRGEVNASPATEVAEIAAPIEAEAQKAVAWIVYLPSMQTQEIFDSQEDAGYIDWLTNYPDAEVTPLYAHPTSSASAEAVALTDWECRVAWEACEETGYLEWSKVVQREFAKKNGWRLGGADHG